MADISHTDKVRAMLEWYQAMGVDDAVAETPLDWAKARFEMPRPMQTPTQSAGGKLAHIDTLEALRAEVAAFEGCGLKRTAKSLCFARGNPDARVMLIGEAPGRDEDLQGLPFVGRAGQLLDRMLRAIDLTADNAYITNVVYWRPPGNRNPSPQEVEACRPFLTRQVELVAPEIMVLLGGAAAKHILGATDGIMKLRGKWRDVTIGGHACRAIATLHPAYLLRNPLGKRLAWRDLLMIRDALDTSG
ncbi:uracil-DNA glycosylase [Dichotomicrobium thermohalophilum]|uniref:Type-4 uracil-DNA glycosylase n=1 Tax=Dichotomicrobium thermohalophilum TaxID=933063 RepID=A0A397PK12_9HYPH|nr:uracil-DNA glycosylase [Dichotomicrobium thermohalophilum]RIA47605.1 DNA polymerase [Dichotomicrobium thermohalophilum]